MLSLGSLFGIDLINPVEFGELLVRFTFNFLVVLVIVRYLYYRKTKRRNFLFTFLLISITVFLMCFLLESVKLQLGFALGLFAVFGIIRYRTDSIPIKEMTYLFIVIGLSVVNALSNKKVSYAELVFTNMVVIFIIWAVERIKNLDNESFTNVIYENIDLVKPQNKAELIDDLERRLGLKISRIEIIRIDFQRDIARIKVFFEKNHQFWAEDEDLDYRTLSNE